MTVPPVPAPARRGSTLLLLAAVLSGAAALIYQIVWTRLLTLVMGGTVAAVTTVLATFMAGLGLGALLAGPYADRAGFAGRRRAYIGVEIGIATGALALPLVLDALTPWLASSYRAEQGVSLALLRVASSASLMLVPTALMGATLPLLVTLLAPAGVGSGAGKIYAVNTAGATLGSLSAVVVLLPSLGLAGSTWVAGAMNLAAAACVAGLRPRTVDSAEGPVDTGEAARHPAGSRAGRATTELSAGRATPQAGLATAALVVAFLSGFGALAHEVAWTRSLVLLFGPNAYTLGFILATVIAGLAAGSALMAPFADRLGRRVEPIASIQLATAVASFFVVRSLGRLPIAVGELVRDHADRMSYLLLVQLGWIASLLAVPSLLFGATFPLAVAMLAPRGLGRAVSAVYSINTLGAIAGSLAGGFFALRALGLERALFAAAAVHGVAAFAAVALAGRGTKRLSFAAVSIAVCVGLVAVPSQWDPALMAGGPYKYAAYSGTGFMDIDLRAGEVVYYEEGEAATVSVKKLGGTLSLAVDGKVDATSSGDMLTQRTLAHVPLVLHGGARRVAIIGLGSGATAGSALKHDIESLDVIEISPEVVEAAELFAPFNGGALDDPRTRVVVGDGRNHMLLAERSYDVVISEPSNPWMTGVSSLFTRDFFELARLRLAPSGLFCQWAHIYNMPEADLKTIVAGFVDAFPAAGLFLVNEGDVLLVGARDRLTWPSAEQLGERLAAPGVAADLAEVSITSGYVFASLFTLQTPSLERWVGEASRHTDDRPVLEFRAPRALHADTALANRASLSRAALEAPPVEPFSSLVRDPSAEDLVARAAMLEMSNSPTWAFETHLMALRLDAESARAAIGVAETGSALKRGEEAGRELRRLADAGSLAALVGLAFLDNHQGRPERAVERLAAVERVDPDHLAAFVLAAEIQDSLGRVAGLEALAGRALEIAPDDADAGALRALGLLRRGRPEQAAAAAAEILARQPRHTRALEVNAVSLATLGRRQAARAAFDALLRSDPYDWSHVANFAVFELDGGDARVAASLFEQALWMNPAARSPYEGLLEATRSLGDSVLLERAQELKRSFEMRTNPVP